MSIKTKTGRNDPCPCGSGRKYKHCHGGAPLAAVPSDDIAEVLQRSLEWLDTLHSREFSNAVRELIFDLFWPDDDLLPEDVDEHTWPMIFMNVNEWLIAQGDIRTGAHWQPTVDLLLGTRGPHLGPKQREFLGKLAETPLRLYHLTDVRPGEGLTLVDAFDDAAVPLEVRERSASRTLKPGQLLGARPIEVDDHLELSGALYPFSPLHASLVLASLDEFIDEHQANVHPEDRPYEIAILIARAWFEQMLLPPPIPAIFDASTGEPLVPTTDHYRIEDREALEARLAACTELEAGDTAVWERIDEDAEGVRRPRLSLRINTRGERIELFCRTQRLADEGRAWFDALAGSTVRHLTREIEDPRGMLAARHRDGPIKPVRGGKADSGPADLSQIDPETMTDLMSQVVRRTYANWADEPIPILDNRSPRELMATPAGLERVKGLLRGYEANEARLAADQGRAPVSFQFLWDALGIRR